MLYYLPIEPLNERYTEQWYRWFPESFAKAGVDFAIIDGEALIEDEIKTGTFLDVNSTLHYKAEQLKRVAALFASGSVQHGDVFFVADVEFWGIEAIKYLATFNNVDVKIYGFAHAGSYTRFDYFEQCEKFARGYERMWTEVFDLIFVGSEYHKRAMVDRRGMKAGRILVTGNPFNVQECRRLVYKDAPAVIEKQRFVVHCNRPDFEKDPIKTLKVFSALKMRNPDWRFAVTTSRKVWGVGEIRKRALDLKNEGWLEIHEGLSKAEYYRLLAEAQVMTGNTREENFGYCLVEAMALNTIPVVEDRYSHREVVQDDRCLFLSHDPDNIMQQVLKIEAAMDSPFGTRHIAERYDGVADRITEIMTNG